MSSVRNITCGMPCRSLLRLNRTKASTTAKSLPVRRLVSRSVANQESRPALETVGEDIPIRQSLLLRPTVSFQCPPWIQNPAQRQLSQHQRGVCHLFHNDAKIWTKTTKGEEQFFKRASTAIQVLLDKPLGSLDLSEWYKLWCLSKRWPNKETEEMYSLSSSFHSEACDLLKQNLALLKRIADEHAAKGFLGHWWWSKPSSLHDVVVRWRNLSKSIASIRGNSNNYEPNCSLLTPLEIFQFIDEIQQIDHQFQWRPPLLHMIMYRASAEDIEKMITTLESREDQLDATLHTLGTTTFLYRKEMMDADLYRNWLQAIEHESVAVKNAPPSNKAPERFLDKMRSVIDQMWSQALQRGRYTVRPNTGSYHFLFREWCRIQKITDAATVDSTVEYDLLEEMKQRGIGFDMSIFGSLVSGWAAYSIKHAARKEPAQTFHELWKQMVIRGVQPTTEEEYFLYLDTMHNDLPPPSDVGYLVQFVPSAYEEMKAAGVSVTEKTHDNYLSYLCHAAVLIRQPSLDSDHRTRRSLTTEVILITMEQMIVERCNSGVPMSAKAWSYYLREVFFTKVGTQSTYRTDFILELRNNNHKNVGIPTERDFLSVLEFYEKADVMPSVKVVLGRVQALLQTIVDLGMTPSTETFHCAIRLILAGGERSLNFSYQKDDELVIIHGLVWILTLLKKTNTIPDIRMFDQILEFGRTYFPNTPILEKLETILSNMTQDLVDRRQDQQ